MVEQEFCEMTNEALFDYRQLWGLPRWCWGKEPACHCRKHKRYGFDSWVGKIPWTRKWQPTPVFLPGKSHGQEPSRPQSMGSQELDTTQQLKPLKPQTTDKVFHNKNEELRKD